MLNRLHYYRKHNILAIIKLWCVQKPQIITNILSSMKVHLASVYDEILSSMKVNLSRMKVNLSSSKVNSSGMKVNLSRMKVNLPKILISKSIVCCVCVMFSSDVSWGSMDENNEFNDKTIPNSVVLLGDSQVGKTQIVNKKQNGEFDAESQETVCVGFMHCNVEIKGTTTQNIKLKVWDMSGDKNYRLLVNPILNIAHAVVLVYDITNKKSFDNIQNEWINIAKANATNDPVYFLVGNKTDKENERKVTKEDAEKFAGDNNMQFFEVSAKNGKDINELFKAIAKNFIKNVSNGSEDNKGDNQTPLPSKDKRCSCCPCCNKDEDDKNEEIISIKPMLNQLNK